MNSEERGQYIAQAKAVFCGMLRKGKPVAFEDAARCVTTPDWFDRRAFGPMVAAMAKDSEIVEAGFSASKTAKHHRGIKRLWTLAPPTQKEATE